MLDPVDALTSLARRVFELNGVKYQRDPGGFSNRDLVCDQFRSTRVETTDSALFAEAVESLRSEADLAGGQLDWDSTLSTLLTNAARLAFMTGGSAQDERFEERFVDAVLDHYEDLKRWVREGTARVYTFTGFAGLDMPGDATIATPWGTIYRLGKVAGMSARSRPRPPTVAMLLRSEVRPATAPLPRPGAPGSLERAKSLAPLVFALTPIHGKFAAPTVTFQGRITSHALAAFSSFTQWVNPLAPVVRLNSDHIKPVERLAALVDERHTEQMDLASDRIVSALTRRSSRSDLLIDAVTAWESLVGGVPDTTLRITAALANLLESTFKERDKLRAALASAYRTRSEVVHGGKVTAVKVESAADFAIEIAARAVLVLYQRGDVWLTADATHRSQWLLLGRWADDHVPSDSNPR